MDKSCLDFAVGDIVNYHSVIGGPVTSSDHKITHIEIRMRGRYFSEALAWISGKAGCVSMEALSMMEG